jgi:hypothetical protein
VSVFVFIWLLVDMFHRWHVAVMFMGSTLGCALLLHHSIAWLAGAVLLVAGR